MSSAATADAEIAAGRRRGPLHGIPLAIKDVFATHDAPTTANSRAIEPGWGAGADAVVVARLRAAGAVVLGKATTNEFACGPPDPTKGFPGPGQPVAPGPQHGRVELGQRHRRCGWARVRRARHRLRRVDPRTRSRQRHHRTEADVRLAAPRRHVPPLGHHGHDRPDGQERARLRRAARGDDRDGSAPPAGRPVGAARRGRSDRRPRSGRPAPSRAEGGRHVRRGAGGSGRRAGPDRRAGDRPRRARGPGDRRRRGLRQAPRSAPDPLGGLRRAHPSFPRHRGERLGRRLPCRTTVPIAAASRSRSRLRGHRRAGRAELHRRRRRRWRAAADAATGPSTTSTRRGT